MSQQGTSEKAAPAAVDTARFGELVLELWLREWTEPSAVYSVSGRDLLRAFCIFAVTDLHRHFGTEQFAAIVTHVLARTADLRQCAVPSPDGLFLLQFKPLAVQKIKQFLESRKNATGTPSREETPQPTNAAQTPVAEQSIPVASADSQPEQPSPSWVAALIDRMQADDEAEASLVRADIARDNYKLVHSVQALVHPSQAETELAEAVNCLGIMGMKDAEAYAVMSMMGLVSRIVSCIIQTKDEDILLALMGLLCCMCHQSNTFPPKDKDFIENKLLPHLFSVLRSGSTSENLGKSVVVTMLTINNSYEFIDVSQSPFINLLITLPPEEVEVFLEIFIAVFNRSGHTHERARDLKFLKEAFSHPACVRLFYTNDLKVVMDIIIREIRDLSDDADSLSVPNRYWEVLYTLLHIHPKAWDNSEVKSLATEKDAEAQDEANRTAKLWASRIVKEFGM